MGVVKIVISILLFYRIIAQVGGVSDDLFRSTYFGFSNALDWDDKSLLQALFWTKWAGEAIRQKRREGRASASLHLNRAAASATLTLPLELEDLIEELPRHNLKRPGNAHLAAALPIEARPWTARRALPARVNLVELFAGAGGMALGFLGAQAPNKELELLFSGEISPVYAQTLRANHRGWNEINGYATLPSHVEAVDLASERSFGVIADATAGKAVSIVVGGPPCQGFSAANRNSWSSENPNNALVEVFFRHVEAMRPRVFLMENVQGILWTSGQGSRLSVADELQARLEKSGLRYLSALARCRVVWRAATPIALFSAGRSPRDGLHARRLRRIWAVSLSDAWAKCRCAVRHGARCSGRFTANRKRPSARRNVVS